MAADEREQRLVARLAARSASSVSRLSCEIGGEQITLFVRDHVLRALCTCGAERCEHFATAVRWLEVENTAHEPVAIHDPRVRSSLRPAPPTGADYGALADAFDALLLAVVRSGVSASGSPSVRDATDRLTATAPSPMPLGLSRWLGRLHEALQRADVGKTARVLEGARIFSDDLRATNLTSQQVARRNAWLSPMPVGQRSVQPLESATLLEVAREWLSGVGRGAIERRYLLNLEQGEIVREERARAESEISVGPCPRVLQVAFGEVESFGAPRRVRLLQYTVSVRPSAQQWAQTEPFAKRLVRHVAEAYETAVSACPALVEPFMLVVPRKVEVANKPTWLDAEGQRMPLAEDGAHPIAELLHQASERGRIVWIAGRLVGLAQGLVLKPVSLLLARADGPHLVRVS